MQAQISVIFRWAWVLVLALFAGLQFPYLDQPLFWDEVGVYGPGIFYMADHGLGLLPDAMPPELSRGHPLGFYFLHAVWVRIFGESPTVLHSLSLLWSLALLFSTFYLGKYYGGARVGWAALLLLSFMPALHAMAVLALPEIPLAVLSLWALHFFAQGKYWAYGLTAAGAIFIKETALVIPLACALTVMVTPRKWISMGRALVPLLPYLLFLLIQKWQHGWFFFPLHEDLISLRPTDIWRKFGRAVYLLIWEQGRWALSLLLALGGIGYWVRKKTLAWRWPRLLTWFGLGWLGFTLINVYMDRYLIIAFPLMALGAAWIWEQNRYPAAYLGLVVLMPLFFWQSEAFRFDMDPNYRQVLAVQKKASVYLENLVGEEDAYFANFPLYNGLLDARYGFVKQGPVGRPSVLHRPAQLYVVRMSPPEHVFREVQPDGNLLRIFVKGYTRIDCYRQKPQKQTP